MWPSISARLEAFPAYRTALTRRPAPAPVVVAPIPPLPLPARTRLLCQSVRDRCAFLLWKTIWLCGIALPLWMANQIDADTRKSFYQIAPVVILIPLLPWGYMFSRYVRAPADRWR